MKNILFITMMIGSAVLATKAVAADEQKQGLSNESAVGIVITSGNTSTSTIRVAQKNSWIEAKNVYKFEASYLRTSNNDMEQALQWGLGVRYERELSDKFNVFLGETLNSDKYQGINQRYNTDIGTKYYFENTETMTWFAEGGYRFTRENYPYGFKNLNFLRLYNEIERTFRKGLNGKWWIEYLPNLTQWKAYQLNSEVSLAVSLTEVFALKSAYQIRFYNEPPAGILKTTDTTFTTSLIAKF
jgi:putative salt-induced outer membrane protein